MSGLPPGGANKTKLSDNILMVIITTDTYSTNEIEQEKEAWENCQEPSAPEFNL